MTKMSPFRWLICTAFASGLYVVFLFSWRDATGSMVPQQINSVALTAVAIAVVFTASAELNDRRDARLAAPLAELAHEVAGLQRHLCEVEEVPTQPLRIAAVGTVQMGAVPADGVVVDAYLAGLAARPEAKVLRMDRHS